MGSVAQQNLFSATDLAVAPVIAVRGLRTAFGDHVVHDNLDLSVYPGEILALVGGSGTGKTVLLRQIIGLERPAAGTIEVLGRRVQELEPAERRRLSHRWGMLFQAGALFSSLSVFDNVALPLRELRTVPEDLVCDVVMCRLAMVGLTSKDADKRPADLSGGMVKRVALARALSLDPELLFLDEPTAGLDPLRSDEFVDLVRSLHRQLRFTVVMVTHDLDTLLALATRVAVLADKRVIVCDTVREVLKVDHPFIRSFFLGERGRRALGDLAPKETGHGKP
ncbi:ABC transporter ATP-binding protein [Bordetella bronchiseptica]|uniref:ABC transporter, ATP-binding protein n=2 Tax=Bordetella bronchiseptica TaxID=518 RepID=A0ABR4RGV4_BORBO|nr:ATP-binding cassette domain-containing protein [Bordetella bronchiseptica]SHS01689.1 Possible ribonucleotide ABC transporter, ATP-binding [Mycobacteroides abscessus subsp. abscessus]AZW19884.1 ABC transporter ATP-binding protein [Bordetella bronchiseptica]KCV35324.1 ABC transporter, ATP-binding protein [Bordetella bronchiseptica 00-P-2796]KDC05116.1 ABC transporter, ATP-binding protein [Bordetella bronchiseptica E013]KDC12778.1 ABC transporter, ATP-binding protein [Bordetella bronchiseptica